MSKKASNINRIRNEDEYYDISERLRIIYRAIIQLIQIKVEYEEQIKEYLERRENV